MLSSSSKIFLLVFFSFCLYANTKLVIRRPEEFTKKFDAVNGIDYAILTPQNKIVYKRSFIGNLILANATDACNPINPIDTVGENAISNPIVVATWGVCHYEQKVKNAEIAGAKMILLVLGHDMPRNHPLIRELPMSTSIGVLAVSKTDGDKIIEFLKDIPNKSESEFEPTAEIAYSYEL